MNAFHLEPIKPGLFVSNLFVSFSKVSLRARVNTKPGTAADSGKPQIGFGWLIQAGI